jgi:hypothetical protein
MIHEIAKLVIFYFILLSIILQDFTFLMATSMTG